MITLRIACVLSFYSQHCLALETKTCHPLQYDSYFVAQNVKGNIKLSNSDLTHANFGGGFLLLRAELAFETLYLIADCNTGKFFHEKLSGEFAQFSTLSPRVELKSKKGEVSKYEWDLMTWIKVAEISETSPAVKTASVSSPIATAPATLTAPTSILNSYERLFAQYPSTETTPKTKVETNIKSQEKCAPLKFDSYFRAQSNKTSIPKLNPDLNQANFAGNLLLIRTETLFDTVYLIADCATGIFHDDFLKGNLSFKATSRLVRISTSDEAPELLIWSQSQWIKILDPVQRQKNAVKNTLYAEKARVLWNHLPNPKHLDTVRFEHLKKSEKLNSLFSELGANEIVSGLCREPRGKSVECEIEML